MASEQRNESSAAYPSRRWVDDVLLVVALIPLAPAVFAFWLATRKGDFDYDLFI